VILKSAAANPVKEAKPTNEAKASKKRIVLI
jgi:hypothetical protein